MNYLPIVLALLFFNPSQPKYVPMVDRATNAFARKMKREHALHVCGTGGSMMYNVKRVMTALEGHQALDQDQTRQLYVQAAEIYLKRINDDRKLTSYLDNYPFDISNLKLSISFIDSSNQYRQDEVIACVHNFSNSTGSGIAYYISPDGKKLELVHKELYSEALQKVKESGALDNVQYLPVR